MKIKTGCVGFHITFRVPNDDVAQIETFFEKHEDFMRETHHIEGTVEPVVLCYAVMRSPEFSNPLEPDLGETGTYPLWDNRNIQRARRRSNAYAIRTTEE